MLSHLLVFVRLCFDKEDTRPETEISIVLYQISIALYQISIALYQISIALYQYR
jgi:hypothetical protein